MCNNIYRMQLRKIDILNCFYLLLMIVFSTILLQRICIFEIPTSNHPTIFNRELKATEYILLLAALILVSLVYFLQEKKRKGITHNYTLIGIFSALAIISVISIIVFPNVLKLNVPVYSEVESGGTIIYQITSFKEGTIVINAEQKVLYILASFAVAYLAYLLIWVVPQKFRFADQFKFLMYFLIAYSLIAIIYSYVTEWELHKLFYSNFSAYLDNNVLIKSFFNHKNNYAAALLFGTLSCFFLYFRERKIYWLPISFVFVFHAIQTYSKTNVLILLIVYPILLFVSLFRNYKTNKKIVLSILISVASVISLFVVGFIIYNATGSFLSGLYGRLSDLFDAFVLSAFRNTNGFTGRTIHYENVNLILNLGHWGTGLGFGLFNEVFIGVENISRVKEIYTWDATTIEGEWAYFNASDSPHSTFYQLVGSGGIVLFVVYVLFMIYVLYAACRVFKKHKLEVIFCLSVIVAAIIHGLMESPTMIFMSTPFIESILFTLLGVIPILSFYYHDNHLSYDKELLENISEEKKLKKEYRNEFLLSKTYLFLSVPFIAASFTSLIQFANASEIFDVKYVYIIEIILCGLLVLIPAIEKLIFKNNNIRLFLKEACLPALILLLAYMGFFYAYGSIAPTMSLPLVTYMAIFVVTIHVILYLNINLFSTQLGIFNLLINKGQAFAYKRMEKGIDLDNKKDGLTLFEKSDSFIKTKILKIK